MSFIFFLITDSWVKNKIKKENIFSLFFHTPLPPSEKRENKKQKQQNLSAQIPSLPWNKSSEPLRK